MTDESLLSPLSYEATCARFVIQHEQEGLRHVEQDVITLKEFELGCDLSRDLLRALMKYMQSHGIVFATRRL